MPKKSPEELKPGKCHNKGYREGTGIAPLPAFIESIPVALPLIVSVSEDAEPPDPVMLLSPPPASSPGGDSQPAPTRLPDPWGELPGGGQGESGRLDTLYKTVSCRFCSPVVYSTPSSYSAELISRFARVIRRTAYATKPFLLAVII